MFNVFIVGKHRVYFGAFLSVTDEFCGVVRTVRFCVREKIYRFEYIGFSGAVSSVKKSIYAFKIKPAGGVVSEIDEFERMEDHGISC
jgi:hypothetical protein